MPTRIRIIPKTQHESRSAMDAVNTGGWVVLAAGVVLLVAPLALNIVIAVSFVASGVTLLMKRIRGDVGTVIAGSILMAFGILTLVWPTVLNYFVIALLLFFHALVNTWMFYWGYRSWAWIYLGVAFMVGILLLLFPTILNYLLGVYLLLTGVYLLAWRWRLRTFTK